LGIFGPREAVTQTEIEFTLAETRQALSIGAVKIFDREGEPPG
jgi:hypothetical protein